MNIFKCFSKSEMPKNSGVLASGSPIGGTPTLPLYFNVNSFPPAPAKCPRIRHLEPKPEVKEEENVDNRRRFGHVFTGEGVRGRRTLPARPPVPTLTRLDSFIPFIIPKYPKEVFGPLNVLSDPLTKGPPILSGNV